MTTQEEIINRINEIKESIFYEIDRRADKEHCLESQSDFTVTISYEEYSELNDLENTICKWLHQIKID